MFIDVRVRQDDRQMNRIDTSQSRLRASLLSKKSKSPIRNTEAVDHRAKEHRIIGMSIKTDPSTASQLKDISSFQFSTDKVSRPCQPLRFQILQRLMLRIMMRTTHTRSKATTDRVRRAQRSREIVAFDKGTS